MKFDLNKLSKRWPTLFYHEFEIDNAIEAYQRLNKTQEESLKYSKEKLDLTIDECRASNAQMDPIDLDQFLQHLYYSDEQIIETLQKLQRYSLVVSIFAFFEGKLKDICENIEIEFVFEIKIDDLDRSKGDLPRYWTYLKKVFGIDCSSVEPQFTPINQCKIVRNILTHQNGIANSSQIKRIPKVPGLNVKIFEGGGLIYLEEYIFIDYLLKKAHNFFNLLLEKINDRYSELKI